MLRRIIDKEKVFWDAPEEISTTGHKPTRGFYTRILLSSNSVIWLDKNNREITVPNWLRILNKAYDSL